ncbi:MAG: hypothetical protein FWC78_02710 [Defluviitaleaceae bacterium]|nr:hypothetical protein [Defluviitaleaceae bacterium]
MLTYERYYKALTGAPEHLLMPNNVCNVLILPKPTPGGVKRSLARADKKLNRICQDIKNGRVLKRGFTALSRLSGKAQGLPWQGDSRSVAAIPGKMEHKAKNDVRITSDCNLCGACEKNCPMKNLNKSQGKITQNHNCTSCYRCVNLCPQRAITVFFHARPRWQYMLPKF